ncbi:hypothetical protein [Tautonia sociabilis]|nr:hypothetical protein [Tautonia sociabilis]
MIAPAAPSKTTSRAVMTDGPILEGSAFQHLRQLPGEGPDRRAITR